MRSTLLLALVSLSTTALADTKCAAQNIVDACVSGYQSRIESCTTSAGNDWICLCNVYTDVLTCYNNCPDSADRSPVEGQKTSYCGAAAPLLAAASASNASAASVAKTATTASPTSAAASTTGSATGASSSASAAAFATNAAGVLTTPAGAAVVALCAAVGLF